jgi:post-segregation antitoxin (ccd killing protein)
VSVYLPDDLYDAVRERDIPLSAVAQRALEEEVRRRSNREWIERAMSRPPRVTKPFDTSDLLDEVRNDFDA